jgi:hypothetical protein
MDLSFWEKNIYFNKIDLLIVGSGIVGLNAALALKRARPEAKILVIDRGFLPYGASTRNAGFACFGSISELLDDLKKMSESEVFELVSKSWQGLRRLRNILGDEEIGFEQYGGYELFTENDQQLFTDCTEKIRYFNAALADISGVKTMYEIADDKISEFGFSGIQHLIFNRGEGQIDTGLMMQVLLKKVRDSGVEIINGIDLTAMHSRTDGVELVTNHGFHFQASKVLVTTNGFARQLLPELAVEPGRAQVFVTAPVPGLSVKGTFYYDKGYYYFRNIGDRVLLGGGRNLDFEGERTTDFGLTATIQSALEKLLSDIILPGKKTVIEQHWSGIMGLGNSKSTIVQQVSKNVYCAVRMGGMGVAIGSLIGEEAASLIVATC